MVLIKYIDKGIAYTVTDGQSSYIEINKWLKNDMDLYHKILNHELGHLKLGNKWLDLWHDLKSFYDISLYIKLWKFNRKFPEANIGYSTKLYYIDDNGEKILNTTVPVMWISYVLIIMFTSVLIWWLIT